MTSHWSSLSSAFVLALACASCGAADPIASQLVFNEIGATGNDFAELRNVSTASVDVSGYALAGSRSDGFPRISQAVRLPAGTVIAPNAYLVVLFEGECPAASMAYVCVRGTTAGGVSQSNGENIHLIDPENQVVATSSYPRAAAPAGWTWGRFPDGTGGFKVTRRTPGATNLE